jgi:hypothetical protein
MKTNGGVNVQIQVFLATALLGVEWSAVSPGKVPPYPLHRRMGGPHSRYGRHAEVKILDLSIVQSVASRYAALSLLRCLLVQY